MNNKIKVQIFGIGSQILSSGCGCSKRSDKGCNNCGTKISCGDCNKKNVLMDKSKDNRNSCYNVSKTSITVKSIYIELENFIKNCNFKDSIELEFIELDKNKFEKKYMKVKEIIDKGYEPPITVIDGIIRYYGGISKELIYKDVKELLE